MDIKITQQVTEELNREITVLVAQLESQYDLTQHDVGRVDQLVAKAVKLGVLYERQKWQAAKADAQPACIHVWRLKNGVQLCKFCEMQLPSTPKKPTLTVLK